MCRSQCSFYKCNSIRDEGCRFSFVRDNGLWGHSFLGFHRPTALLYRSPEPRKTPGFPMNDYSIWYKIFEVTRPRSYCWKVVKPRFVWLWIMLFWLYCPLPPSHLFMIKTPPVGSFSTLIADHLYIKIYIILYTYISEIRKEKNQLISIFKKLLSLVV